jgi:putative peptide zinc metalloprotease protein
MKHNGSLPALRKELEFSSQQHLGKEYVIVKDPVTKRYFRFTQNQAVLLELLREPADLNFVAESASQKLGGTVSPSMIQAFVGSLDQKFLLDTESVRETLATVRSQKLEARNLLYWKLASINPERIFSWLLPRTQWGFTKSFHLFAAFSIASGFVLTVLHWNELTGRVQELFSLHGLFLIWIVTFTVVTLHEFSHGLTCCHFGGTVQEVGFMLIYFQPAFYCDVSDSWMFPAKRHRMWVTFAGGYVQLVIWGICTILWRITDTDTAINQIALVVIVFSGLQTLVNFNPLIKLDGYYILSDYLEIPNLRSKAISTVWNWIAGKHASTRPWREQRAQFIYGTCSVVFSTTLLIYVYSTLFSWATNQFAFAGLVGFVMFSTYTLRRTAVESIAGLKAVAARATTRRIRNMAIFAAALLVSFVGRWELKIPAEFKVIAHSDMAIRTETGGTVVEVLVREGNRVAKGEVIAKLRDYGKQQQISDLTGALEERKNELALLRAGTRSEEIERQQKQVETKKVELQNAQRNAELLNEREQVLEQKRSQYQLDQIQFKRAHQMFDEGLTPRNELERAETQVTVREREIAEIQASIRVISETAERETALKTGELAEAQSQLKLMQAGSRPEEVRQKEAEVNKLESQIQLLNQELAKTEIRAPVDGVIATPFVERKLHQYLDPGDEFCRIVDIDHVWIEMMVPEKELADVHAGNTVWMKVRGFPAMDLQGHVDSIAPVAQTLNGQQMVPVRTELPNGDLILKSDMTGVAKIYCGEQRIIQLMTRRFVRWLRTEFWDLLP